MDITTLWSPISRWVYTPRGPVNFAGKCLCSLEVLFLGVEYIYSHTQQHTAPHCNTHRATLQHSATLCNTLQHTATHGVWTHARSTTLHYIATHTATHICNTLEHTATHCSQLQHTVCPHACSNSLHRTATHTLQHCNTLQHTAKRRVCTHARSNASCSQARVRFVGLFPANIHWTSCSCPATTGCVSLYTNARGKESYFKVLFPANSRGVWPFPAIFCVTVHCNRRIDRRGRWCARVFASLFWWYIIIKVRLIYTRVCVYIHIRICIYRCVYIRVYIYVYMYIHTCVHIYSYIYMNIFVYKFTHSHTHLCTNTHLYVYIHYVCHVHW